MAITGMWGDWTPFEDMDRLRRELARTFGLGTRRRTGVALRVTENPEGLTVQMEVPGVDPDDVELTASGDMITLKGERRAEEIAADVRVHRRERWSGSFTRSLAVPGGFDPQQVEATCRDGFLTVRLPRRAEAKPRQIEVRKD